MLSRASRLRPVVGNRTAMSTPSMAMPMIWATGSYLRSIAKSRRPVSARREPESGWVLFVAPGLPRLRYCCNSASIVVGNPSMTMVPRLGRPSAPMGRSTRLRNRGSRYFSKRSGGSMMCMSQSTNLSPSFMTPSSLDCPLLAPQSLGLRSSAEFYSGDASSATLSSAGSARAILNLGGGSEGGVKPPPSLVAPQFAVVRVGIVVAALLLADRRRVLRAPLEGARVGRGIVGPPVSLARLVRREANLAGGAAGDDERRCEHDHESRTIPLHGILLLREHEERQRSAYLTPGSRSATAAAGA